MAKPNRLKEIETSIGPLEEVIPRLVNEGGQKHAADRLNISITTISLWLKANGYVKRERWEKTA